MLIKFGGQYALLKREAKVVVAHMYAYRAKSLALYGYQLVEGQDFLFFERRAEGWQMMMDVVQQWRRKRLCQMEVPILAAPESVLLVSRRADLERWVAGQPEGVVTQPLEIEPPEQAGSDEQLAPRPKDSWWEDFTLSRMTRFHDLRGDT